MGLFGSMRHAFSAQFSESHANSHQSKRTQVLIIFFQRDTKGQIAQMLVNFCEGSVFCKVLQILRICCLIRVSAQNPRIRKQKLMIQGYRILATNQHLMLGCSAVTFFVQTHLTITNVLSTRPRVVTQQIVPETRTRQAKVTTEE